MGMVRFPPCGHRSSGVRSTHKAVSCATQAVYPATPVPGGTPEEQRGRVKTATWLTSGRMLGPS
ncbi:unnamed protein product [Chrysoparadoxa australica]